MRTYRRSGDGHTVHRGTCPLLRGRGHPWPYADGFDAAAIERTVATIAWLRACRVCRPHHDDGGA